MATVEAAAECHHQAYQTSRRPVPGVIPLLKALRTKADIAVVTNNLVAVQRDKLQACGLEPFIDVCIISEEAGVTKPHPAIFEAALQGLACNPDQAVMVGDSWQEDIVGAHQVGIQAVWLNRYGLPCPDPTLATEIHSFLPLDTVLSLLLAPPGPRS